ncbi:MAG: phenylacetic acid degradation protein [Anaerolineae bacterium]|nr:MAG: phenylacetic acid degradation protein [Anaerolineae bacterium]
MSDTQWPRFMVFQQVVAGEPLVHNGTVHAPDLEMSLLNGRDVFLRRPAAHALWVVPVECILTKTIEELQDGSWLTGVKEAGGPMARYHVFGKLHHQGQLEQIGMVEAAGPEQALKTAMSEQQGRTVWVWWVFPVSSVLASDEDDIDSLFRFAESHDFKNQAYYPVITMMRQIRARGKR